MSTDDSRTTHGPDDPRAAPGPDDRLEDALRGTPAADDAFREARERFAARAVDEGAVGVAYEDHDTPVGVVRIGATPEGVVRLVLPAEDADDALARLAASVSPRILRARTPVLAGARRELDEYFAGRRRGFDVALDWRLVTAFRREVLRATALIPFGETSSYRGVATAAGSPNAVRAAGTALATNPLPIIVPCHRVVRSDGALGNYLGGVEMKARLLELEGAAA
ncbi:methylated-DNA--[protein]-cysteine S-methyltransferase [Patulibacter minatonensis]|uniref:methylated-DNA--[protein]-cysteine S-methyltransferase n=1 Tax=Patulibacter minatonensis TaxID=298163 RepID=UPI0009FD7109|nr:methylated-DNA--[protein]-cysteine S-methyltransferase [Patulibacter minatonensis]